MFSFTVENVLSDSITPLSRQYKNGNRVAREGERERDACRQREKLWQKERTRQRQGNKKMWGEERGTRSRERPALNTEKNLNRGERKRRKFKRREEKRRKRDVERERQTYRVKEREISKKEKPQDQILAPPTIYHLFIPSFVHSFLIFFTFRLFFNERSWILLLWFFGLLSTAGWNG